VGILLLFNNERASSVAGGAIIKTTQNTALFVDHLMMHLVLHSMIHTIKKE
jgi:hypothetical protein